MCVLVHVFCGCASKVCLLFNTFMLVAGKDCTWHNSGRECYSLVWGTMGGGGGGEKEKEGSDKAIVGYFLEIVNMEL